MEKNVVIAIVLSMLVLFVWYGLFSPPPRRVQESVPQSASPAPAAPYGESVKAPEKGIPSPSDKTDEISIETGTSKITLTSKGARILNWYIKEPHQETDLILSRAEDILPVDLKMDEARDLSGKIFGFAVRVNSKASTDRKIILKDGECAEISFSYNLRGTTLSKIYTFRYDGYLQNVRLEISNRRNEPVTFTNVSLTWCGGLGIDKPLLKENMTTMKTLGLINGRLRRRLQLSSSYEGVEWLGLVNRYFIAAMVNRGQFPSGRIDKSNKVPLFELCQPSVTLASGGTQSYDIDLFVGPKNRKALNEAGGALGRIINYGFFDFFGQIFLKIMNFFYGLTNNYGFAIILLTCVLQLVLFPLTKKSLKAAEDMKVIQPEMKMLQEKYKHDPKRLNVEMMNLYKAKKVNPFGGCLPMLFQLPIFYVLFTMLRSTYELRNAPFIFWIKDLSAKDPFYILPVLMGVSMLIQQRRTTVSADPSQARTMMLMPVVFTFVFLSFPAGLVLYWLTNNILTLIEYAIIGKISENQKRKAV